VETRSAYTVLVGKPEGKKSLGRLSVGGRESIGIHVREIGVELSGFSWLRVGTNGGLL
jgi:hypothetical protein